MPIEEAQRGSSADYFIIFNVVQRIPKNKLYQVNFTKEPLMHLIDPVRLCIDDIIKSAGLGMKSMIMDDFTTSVVGVAYGRSEMLLREVYLIEYITSICESSERLNNLKCIVILRPTKENIELLCNELNHPHYRTYHLYFTGRIGSLAIKKLAEADEREVVRALKELPLDFCPLSPFVFHLKLTKKTYDLKHNTWLNEGLKRTADGLTSLLMALQIQPVIRYQTQSELCKSLADLVTSMIKTEYVAQKNIPSLDTESLLLILDRRMDQITPIIHSWNYASMIHEEFDVVNNCINLENVPNRQPKDPREMLLSMENDHFYRNNFHKNFGELGPTLLSAVETLKSNSRSQQKVETLADMKRFIEEYPENKRYATDLHNHVFLLTELGRLVSEFNLMSVSECEQELVCDLTSQADIVKKIGQLICSSKVRAHDALRLICLHVICHPDRSRDLGNLKKLLRTRIDITKEDILFLDHLRDYNRSKPRNPGDDTVQRVARKIKQGVQGVDNVLTEYTPALSQILIDLSRGNKLKESDFAHSDPRHNDDPARRIIVYMIGGVTLDEAHVVDHINRISMGRLNIIIGGSCTHNFGTFKKEITQCVDADQDQ